MTTNFSKEFEFARTTILKASEIPLSYLTGNIVSRIKPDNTIVTQADEETEIFFRTTLGNQFQSYGFLGEEGDEQIKDIFWIIDPIDGTTAFARKLSEFVLVLSLVVERNVVFSLIYNPVTRELYHAQKGNGAYKNDIQIHASNTEKLSDAYISIGKSNFQQEPYVSHSQSLAMQYKFRVAPSSGVESIYLSEGKIDVFIKVHQSIWDVAPECLLMEESGAIISDDKGNPLELTFSKTAKHNFIAMAPEIYKNEREKLFFRKIKIETS